MISIRVKSLFWSDGPAQEKPLLATRAFGLPFDSGSNWIMCWLWLLVIMIYCSNSFELRGRHEKNELITKVAVDAEISKAKAEAEVNSLINSVTEELKAGGAVALTGFGTFQVKERAARTGRTP